MARRPKHKYNVYVRQSGWGVYAEGPNDYFVGETWAVSEKQAVNNVRFRNEGATPNSVIIGDILEEGELRYEYVAEMA